MPWPADRVPTRPRVLLFAFSVAALAIFNIIQSSEWSKCQHPALALDDSLLSRPEAVKATVDDEATDCTNLLDDFRNYQIKETKHNIRGTFTKSHIVLATADQNRTEAFYISTHEKAIDATRAAIMDYRVYYEMDLSAHVARTYDIKAARGEESIFLDVGANIGWFSLVARRHGATQVYSFEPNVQNTIRFCESLALNGFHLDGSVVPIMKGAGETEGEEQLYAVNENNPGTFTFEKLAFSKVGQKSTGLRAPKAIGTLQITTLDGFAERHRWFETKPSIGFFKVDVERYELHVLRGARKLLQSQLIERIALELQPDGVSNSTKKETLQILWTAGYKPVLHGGYRGPNRPIDVNYETFEDLAVDFLAKKYRENILFELR